MKRTAWETISELEKKYANDKDALKVIETEKMKIKYIEEEEKKGNYNGQTPEESVLACEGFLEMWY